jgi:ATP-dependent RNA helicase RhlE
MTDVNTTQSVSFDSLGLAPTLLEILKANKFEHATPIQAKAIPAALQGSDVIGIAQTGTGKTLAFGLPMIERLARYKGRGLVILPTRELALQVEESLRKIGGKLGMKSAVLIGGDNMGKQIRALRERPHLIIATPGRLIDHLDQKTIRLDEVKVLVLDEADRMLDMGFAPQIKRILESVPTERQTLLFSATMPADIVTIATKHMKLPVRIEVAPAGTASERVAQELIIVQKAMKGALLESILKEFAGTVLVFSRTKHGATKICTSLIKAGHKAAEIHSNRSLNQRKEALSGFKTGKYRVLVATDIAARGIDVKEISLVVNYDLPDAAEDYVHRIGRTGRAGHEGRAISFATPDQAQDVRDIERLIRNKLPLRAHASLPKTEFGTRGSAPRPPMRRGSGKPFAPRPAYGQRPSGYGQRNGASATGSTYSPVKSTSASPSPRSESSRTDARGPKRPFNKGPRKGGAPKARGFRKYEPAERFDKEEDGPSTGQYAFRTTL